MKGKNDSSGLRSLIKAAFIIAVVCILCEIFVFNARHFVTLWGDGPVDMRDVKANFYNMAYDDRNGSFLPSKNTEVELDKVRGINGNIKFTPSGNAEIEIPDVNRRVVTVYIDAVFDGRKREEFRITYKDEDSTRTTARFSIMDGVEESKYITLQMSGKASWVKVTYNSKESSTRIRGVTLNKPVPLKIFWPRLCLFFFPSFAVLVIKRKKLFSIPVNQDSRWQNFLTGEIMAAFVVYLFMLMLLASSFSIDRPLSENFAREPRDQYNAEVVDALLAGQPYLKIEPSKKSLELKNPYDIVERRAARAEPPWDHVLYNGKLYSYFGIVQVLVLALPYKLITGNYIPTRVAVFLFAALASVFLMLLWHRLVFRFMKNMPSGMYMLGQIAVAMCSMITFPVVRPLFYEVAGTSALFFTASGLWLILGSTGHDRVKLLHLTLGCLCMALAAGCRPNYMFVSLLVPVILFKDIQKIWHDKKRFACLCACTAVPYIIVVCGLMWYNYIRFDSVFEFGANYHITVRNIKASHLRHPMGKLLQVSVGCFCYLISSVRVEPSFPFVYLNSSNAGLIFKGEFYSNPVLGVLAVPLTWFLFSLGAVKKIVDERRRPIFHLAVTMLCTGLLQMAFVSSPFGGLHTRYLMDFFWLFVFPGLICAYFIYERLADYQHRAGLEGHPVFVDLCGAAQKIICTGIILSVVLVFLLTLSSGENNRIWNNNPDAFYFIQRLLGFNTL